MHQIKKTNKIMLEEIIWEVELEPHHFNSTYEQCENDCPEGWEIATYPILQHIRNNNSKTRKQFNLLITGEYIQNPDNLCKREKLVAWFSANKKSCYLFTDRAPHLTDDLLGVRYVRKCS